MLYENMDEDFVSGVKKAYGLPDDGKPGESNDRPQRVLDWVQYAMCRYSSSTCISVRNSNYWDIIRCEWWFGAQLFDLYASARA